LMFFKTYQILIELLLAVRYCYTEYYNLHFKNITNNLGALEMLLWLQFLVTNTTQHNHYL
jgi:hypothetical protein